MLYLCNGIIFLHKKTFSTLYGTPISIYFSNNYFTIVTMQDYFGVLYVCACVCVRARMYIYIYIYINIYIYVYICIYMYIYVYIFGRE